MNRSAAGARGEDQAVQLLESEGLSVIARNFRTRVGEVDIVALEGDSVVFVEVKAWSKYGIEDLEYAIGPRKIARIVETAKIFLSLHREYNCMAVRFDVVFIGPDGIRHLASAFTERV
jgi:putative endonuclease